MIRNGDLSVMKTEAVVGKTVKPFTPEEREPFTTDMRAQRWIANIFPNGQVTDCEADPLFLGWIVQGKRPLGLFFDFDAGHRILGYSDRGSLFPTYAEAVDATVRTREFFETARRVGDEPPWKIFNIARQPDK